MGASLQISNLSVVRNGRSILDVAHLEILPGQVVATIGPNGAGKSTLLKVLSHLVHPTSGLVKYKGEVCNSSDFHLKARREMAMVFQDSLLLSGTVFYNVITPLMLRGVRRKVAIEKAIHWLDRMGIAHLAHQNVRGLSGGEAQRVSLARAFAVEPQVLFLDEPFTSLDAPTRVLLMDELEQIIKSTGVTALFVTHDFDGIPFYATRVLVLENGKIVRDDALEQILRNPSSPFLNAFFRNAIVGAGMKVDKPANGLSTTEPTPISGFLQKVIR